MVATGANPKSNMQDFKAYHAPSQRATSPWLSIYDAAAGRCRTTPWRIASPDDRLRVRPVGRRHPTRDLPTGRRERQAVVRARSTVGVAAGFRVDRRGGAVMNLSSPSVPALANMLRECCDENSNHVVWIDSVGDIHITTLRSGQSPVTLERSEPTMKHRYPTLCAGCGYTGPTAADDAQWVLELLSTLVAQWQYGMEVSP